MNNRNLNNQKKHIEKGTAVVPKKGRIRIVLLMITLILFFFLFNNKKDKSQKTELKSDTTTVVKKNIKSKNIKKIEKKKLFAKKKKVIKLPKKFNKDDLRKLINLEPSILSSSNKIISNSKNKYQVFTSIDTVISNTSKKLLRRYHPLYGAIVLLEPQTGRVLSMTSYTNGNKDLESLGNRLYLKGIFPAASVFKTVTAAAAIEKKGLTPDSKIKTVGANHTLYSRQLQKNVTNYKLVTFRNAFAYSYNPVFGRVGMYVVGADGLNEYALRFGFNSKIPFVLDSDISTFVYPESSFAIAEVASGFNQSTQISPLFGALMASSVVNGGKICIPTVIDSVKNLTSEKTVYKKTQSLWRRPLAPSTAEKVKDIMLAVPRYGTARKSFKLIKKSYRFKNIEYGGKTGSVDKDGLGKIDWFIGFANHKTDVTQRVAVAVVTVHDGNWTVHSSYIGAEVMRHYIRNRQLEIAKIAVSITDTLLQKGKS